MIIKIQINQKAVVDGKEYTIKGLGSVKPFDQRNLPNINPTIELVATGDENEVINIAFPDNRALHEDHTMRALVSFLSS